MHDRELTREDLAGVWSACNVMLLCLLWGRNDGEPLNQRTTRYALRSLASEVDRVIWLIEQEGND